MNSCGPEGANDYSPGCQPGVPDKNRFNSEGVAEKIDKHGVGYDPEYLWD
jgi:hypothetical protein